MRTIAPLCLCAALVACEAQPTPAAGAPPVPTSIKGRIVDDRGVGLAGVFLLFHDTTRLTGHRDKRGCGTYNPQFSLTSDAEGRFAGELPFKPTRVQASGRIDWVELPLPVAITDPAQELILTAHAIPHRTVIGKIIDVNGAPIAGASVLPEPRSVVAIGKNSDDQGQFQLELAEPLPETLRARRMGYRPVLVKLFAAERIVLADRRPMVTVTVEENGAPVKRLVRVSLWQRGERLSFCTAGLALETSEPLDGVCTLDAEPGEVELRLEDKAVTTLTVKDSTHALKVTAPPLPAISGDGY